MKYKIQVSQDQAIQLGIKNINQAHIFDLLTTSAVWAKAVAIDNEIYYWVARQTICSELPLLNLKPDTTYRHLKSLETLGLIDYVKSGKRDCIKITELGKKYHSSNTNDKLGNKSEKIEEDNNNDITKNSKNDYYNDSNNLNIDKNTMSEINPNNENDTMSEINPNKLGNKSENNSEINPTYPTTIHYPSTILSHYEIKPKDIITFYYKNISQLQEKIKEIKSINAMALLPPEDNLQMLLIGLENYSKVLPVDEKYIKSLLNFIQDRAYRDYQVAKELKPTQGNNKTNDMIKSYFNNHNQSDKDIEEARIIS
ncbi:hypothetical protein [Arcobacter sp.]|uniref:hypothetical protein n=1 Tax=unclassified Arcobacter TaxID=2593671 RepID=UPI003B00B180